MNRNSQHIEHLFKQKFQDLEIRPEKKVWHSIDNKMWLSNFRFHIENLFKNEQISTNEKVWKNINRKLWIQDYFRFSFRKFNVYYSTMAVVCFVLIFFNVPKIQNDFKELKSQINTSSENLQKFEFPTFDVKNKKHTKNQIANIISVDIENKKLEKKYNNDSIKSSFLKEYKKETKKTNRENSKIKFKNIESNKYAILPKKKTHKWYLNAYSTSNNSIESNDIIVNGLNSEMFGLNVGYTVNNFIFEVGVEFNKPKNIFVKNDSISIFNIKQTNIINSDSLQNYSSDSINFNNYLASSYINVKWAKDSTNSQSVDTTSIYEILNSQKLYSTVEIPIMFGYQITHGNFNCAIKGGLISALYFKPEEKMRIRKDNSFDIKNKNLLVKADFSFTLAFGIEYKLNDSFSLTSEPFYRKTLNSIFANESTYIQRYNSYGLKLGVKYTL